MVDIEASRAPFSGLEGDWSGEETLYPSPWAPGGTAIGSWRIRRDGSGLHLVLDYAERAEGRKPFDAHSVLTVDPENGDTLFFLFDSYGFPPLQPARGRWDGRRLVLEKTTPRGTGRTTIELLDGGFAYGVAIRAPDADEFTPVMDGRYRRR